MKSTMSLTVKEKTKTAETPVECFNNILKSAAKSVKNLAATVMKNSGRALEIGAKTGKAAASKNLQAALSTILDVIINNLASQGLYLGKFV